MEIKMKTNLIHKEDIIGDNNLPDHITVGELGLPTDEDFGYVLGVILGDGYLYSHPDISRGAYIIRLRVTSRAFAEEFRGKLEKVTNKPLKVVPYTAKIKDKILNLYKVNCYSKFWIEYFRALIQHLEKFIADSNLDTLKGFVRGYIDSEGCVSIEPVSIGIVTKGINKSYMDSFAKALGRLGFHINRYSQYTKKGTPLYEVTIKGIYFVRKYATEIGFIDIKKQVKALSKDYKTEWSRERSMRRFGICIK